MNPYQEKQHKLSIAASVCAIVASVALVCSVLFDGCSAPAPATPTPVAKPAPAPKPPIVEYGDYSREFDRLFMHDPAWFSVMIIDENGQAEFVQFTSHNYSPIVVVCDAPPDKPMWYAIQKATSWGGWDSATIHIHAPQDVNGAGWNRGKGGTGQTTVVE